MKKIFLVGKAWEIRYMLKQYAKQFQYVEEWIDYQNQAKKKPSTKPIKISTHFIK